MTVIFRLAWRHMNRRFVQSLLFVIGVALGVAMMVAIDVANGSAMRAFALSSDSITGSTTHQIIGGPGGLPTELYQRVRVELGIRSSAPVIEEVVYAPEMDNQPLRLLGVDAFADTPFRSYLATIEVDNDNTGEAAFNALNRFVAEPDTVLMSTALADRYGIQAGDRLRLRAGIRAYNVEVIGLLQADDRVSEQALNDLMLADIATAQEIIGQPGRITRVDLILPEGQVPQILETIQEILPAGARVASVTESGGTLEQMADAFELNLQALSLLALVVGIFLIYNTVTFSVVQRRPVIGIMRSVGTTQRQIFLLVLSEALILGLVGTLVGLGLGVIFGRGAVDLVSRTISDLYFTVTVQRVSVESYTLAKGAVVGLLTSVGTAVLPALSATTTPATGTMRRSDQEDRTRRLIPWVTLGAVGMILTGLALLRIESGSIILSFAALFAIVVGGACLTPLALLGAMRLSLPLADAMFGVIGRMAPRAVMRSLSRTSVAVAALTVAVSVIVGVSVMVGSFRSTVAAWLETTLGSDIYISSPLLAANRDSPDVDPVVGDLILAVDGVIDVASARIVQVSAPDYPNLPLVNLNAIDDDIAIDRRFAWNTAGDDYMAVLEAGKVMVSEAFAFRREITPEYNTITLLTDRGEETFEVIAVFYDYSTDQGRVYMADRVYRQYYDDPFTSTFGATIEPGADVDVVADAIRQAVADYDLQVQVNRDLRAGVFEVFDNTFAITVALRLLATLVAFIGILSALLALQLENTRQYGVMRASGMTPFQLLKFTLVQTGLMGVTAGALAMPIGLALALVLLHVINVRSFGWSMTFRWIPGEFAQAFSVAVAAAVIAGLYPAWRLARLVTTEALRSE